MDFWELWEMILTFPASSRSIAWNQAAIFEIVIRVSSIREIWRVSNGGCTFQSAASSRRIENGSLKIFRFPQILRSGMKNFAHTWHWGLCAMHLPAQSARPLAVDVAISWPVNVFRGNKKKNCSKHSAGAFAKKHLDEILIEKRCQDRFIPGKQNFSK